MKRVLQYSRPFAIPTLCIAFMLVLTKCVFFVGYVPSASMEPTVSENSWILGVRLYSELDIDDIIIFNHGGRVLLKRVSATAGDTIMRPDGSILTVPEECYYVLGDNLENSIDSRYWDEPFVKGKEVLAVLMTQDTG